jgi:predicted nucleotidyltransferase
MAESGSLISDKDYSYIYKKLLALQNRLLDKYTSNMYAIGYLTSLFEKVGLKPVIVGGHAVELYTAGHYSTFDVDLVLSGRQTAGEILERLGFIKRPGERHWTHKELFIPIEIPDDTLAGSMDRVIEVATEEGFRVYVIGVEDLILDRAKAAVYWESLSDREWALLLMNAQWQEIDFDYLLGEARKELGLDVYNLVLQLKQETEELIANEEKAPG